MESEIEKEATAAALRAQLQTEIQNIKQCAYQSYDCTQLTLEGYKYCSRHILQDSSAPYKPCAYVFNSNGKRCHLPAPREKKDSGYCAEHAVKLQLNTHKRNNHCQPPRTAEVLLNFVSHYINKEKPVPSNSLLSDDYPGIASEEKESLVTKSLDPFVDINASRVLAAGNKVLDMCSDSESDIEPTVYGSVWHDAHAESSDNDSLDSEQEDLLKHANIYSAEEITLITRDKLSRLRELYIKQYHYLHHMLKEQRRKYLFALKQEKEAHCNIYNQVHENTKEQRLYKKLKAYNSYHKEHGNDAVCVKRLHERRLKLSEATAPKPPSYTKCIFTEGGVKCGEATLPVTRHCSKHILEDPNQILFRVCGKMCGDIECRTPVESIFDDATCRLHTDFPPIRTYSQIRKDSESDHDDSLTRATPAEDTKLVKDENVDIENEFDYLPSLKLPSDILNPELVSEDINMGDDNESTIVDLPSKQEDINVKTEGTLDMTI